MIQLSEQMNDELLLTLQRRFLSNMHRHEEMQWEDIKLRLQGNPEKIWSLHQMEVSGGEPDVIGFDIQNNEYIFCDCVPESPKGRRSLCYDQAALDSRKENKPKDSATEMASAMKITLTTEDEYRKLQELGEFDTKTSSWISTPPDFRELGGALFGDRRYNRVFVYHNGAESYYSARGFRGILKV